MYHVRQTDGPSKLFTGCSFGEGIFTKKSAVYLKYPPRKSLFPYNVTDGGIRTDKVIYRVASLLIMYKSYAIQKRPQYHQQKKSVNWSKITKLPRKH